jgi:hypothetical protein
MYFYDEVNPFKLSSLNTLFLFQKVKFTKYKLHIFNIINIYFIYGIINQQ